MVESKQSIPNSRSQWCYKKAVDIVDNYAGNSTTRLHLLTKKLIWKNHKSQKLLMGTRCGHGYILVKDTI